MSYTVLARRYRSQSFDQVVGQEAIARTLAAAIEQDRVAHAYLFTGTRGVGKTSMARIFAKALNAPDEGPDGEVSKAIMQGRDTDVIEIDGASNNSVEQARELIAGANYKPMRGRRKIYIIDEVHMLSQAAFNALLKTMEEPPEHVVFILCTTETHKVPATIQSRCQRFDFKNIPTAAIAGHLRSVLKDEKVKAEGDLVHMVARLGNGSMRDALSILDRLLASGEKTLGVELLEGLLGLAPRQRVHTLADAIASGDPASALAETDGLLDHGLSIDLVLNSLADYFRDLMVLATCGKDSGLVELTDDALEQAWELSKRFDAPGLVHNIALCDAVARNAKTSGSGRALLDASIVRLAMAENLQDVSRLLASGGGGGGGPKKA